VLGQALAPLRIRYAGWLALESAAVLADREEAESEIRAMQLVLRLEREIAPSWHGALALAAGAAAALCLDERAQPGGPWHAAVADYCAGHIRKVTRRARGVQWDVLDELPGLLCVDGPTQVRALVPGPVAELDKRVSRLQVGGTDAQVDSPPVESPPSALIMWIPPEPGMTLGKTMAQAGHAGMIAAALLAGDDQDRLREWAAAGCPALARRATAAEWAELSAALADPERAWRSDGLLAVRDAGFTEIAPGTVTVIARAR
jgi:peptidyl-tRNA hydrolase